MWLFNPYWEKKRLNIWPEITDAGTQPAQEPVDDPVVEPETLLFPDDTADQNADYGVELSFYQQIEDDPAAQPESLAYLLDAPDEALELIESNYFVIDDDVGVAPDTLTASFDLDEPVDQDPTELSFYAQLDDDPAVAPDELTFDPFFADDARDDFDASFYLQFDDDAGVAPDTLFGNFDYIEENQLFDSDASFYVQNDDGPIAPPEPPATVNSGGGRVRRVEDFGKRPQSKAEARIERMALGIIRRVARKQVESEELNESAQLAELQAQFALYQIQYETIYLLMLERERQALLQQIEQQRATEEDELQQVFLLVALTI